MRNYRVETKGTNGERRTETVEAESYWDAVEIASQFVDAEVWPSVFTFQVYR